MVAAALMLVRASGGMLRGIIIHATDIVPVAGCSCRDTLACSRCGGGRQSRLPDGKQKEHARDDSARSLSAGNHRVSDHRASFGTCRTQSQHKAQRAQVQRTIW